MRKSFKTKLGFSFLLSINLLLNTLVLCQCVAPLTSIKLSQIPTMLREQPHALKKITLHRNLERVVNWVICITLIISPALYLM